VKEESVGFLFNIEVQIEEAPAEVSGVGAAPVELRTKGGLSRSASSAQRAQQNLLYSAPTIDGEAGSGGAVMVQEPGAGNGAATKRAGRGRGGARTGGQSSQKAPEVPAAFAPPTTAGRVGSTRGGLAGAASIAGAQAGGSSPGAQAANRLPSPGQVVGSGPSRNGPCPCGSGKKYKRCHGAPGA
jgi:preprotein translocase subunit SecA